MKTFKTDSPFEQKLQKIETLCNELGIHFDVQCDTIFVADNEGHKAKIYDVESGCESSTFPRSFESEKLALDTDSWCNEE